MAKIINLRWNFAICWAQITNNIGLCRAFNTCSTAHWFYYGCTLGLPSILKQLLSSSLMEILKPGCPGNVESGETSLSWLYTRSIGSQCKTKDQRYCMWSLRPRTSFQVTIFIKNTWPKMLGLSTAAAAPSEALWEKEGQKLGSRSTLGERQGPWLTHSLTHSLTE